MRIKSLDAPRALLLAACLLGPACAWAQLGTPTSEELSRRGNGPGPVPGGARNAAANAAGDANTDPRNFAGTWRANLGPGGPGGPGAPGGGPGRGPGGPGAPGNPGAPGANGEPPPGVPAGQVGAPGTLNQRVICVPGDATQPGVDGPLLLVQTPQQITWAAEEMHSIRRIYLTGGFTQPVKPSFLGEAIGHWEGDTLVIETRGLNSLPPGAKMIEHWHKSADGRALDISIDKIDADGKALGATRSQSLRWAPGDKMLEWMCEDYNEEWLPGGKDYKDQINK